MDVQLKALLCANSLKYKRSLDRIIDKYSKLQYQDGGIEVDLDNTNVRALERYMSLSKTELNKLESKSLTDLRDETLGAQDITRDSQLDLTLQDSGADETCASNVSSAQLSMEDGGMAGSDMAELTVSSLDESQPEDQDEALEMSLRSNGSSWVELYPSMINRIERAWHRQHVSEAADSVLRRYRRWRQQPNKSINNTFTDTRRHGNQRELTGRTLLEESSNSPLMKRQFMESEATLWSPSQMLTNSQDWRAQQRSPREQYQPILVMDLSDSSETSKPKEILLNKTFNMSQLEDRPSTYTVSPSRLSCPTSKASLDLSVRSTRHSLAAHSVQTDRCSMYTSQNTSVRERPDIYGSPVRQSPLKARMLTGLSRSPQAFSRSPTAHSVESFSREPVKRRSMSTLLSSPPQKPSRMLYPQNSHHSFRPHLPSPQSTTTAGDRHRLRRHLSFDSSSLSSIRVNYSPKKLDEDLRKLYHKFVCQNKSPFFNGPPCRVCASSSEASRGHSSSLAALALSPHRSLLRKRHRELSWESHRQSKRPRDEYCASSPGSKRHGNELLRRRLSVSEYEQPHDGLSYSPSKHSLFQRFSTKQHSADAHQETWMSRGHSASTAGFSGLANYYLPTTSSCCFFKLQPSTVGGSLESQMVSGYSPRK